MRRVLSSAGKGKSGRWDVGMRLGAQGWRWLAAGLLLGGWLAASTAGRAAGPGPALALGPNAWPAAGPAAAGLAAGQDVGGDAAAGVRSRGLDVQGYRMDVELDPAAHTMTATAVVTFTAPEGADAVRFELHPALKITRITDDAGRVLTGERTSGGGVRIEPAAPMDGRPMHWTFVYAGRITGNEDGPVEGLKLAAIGDPITYLLYPARWFPMNGYLTDRFTMELHVRVPQGERVIGSGAAGVKQIALEDGKPGTEYDFAWTKPGFPGTLVAGRFAPAATANVAANVKAYVTEAHSGEAGAVAETAARAMDFFTGRFGEAESGRMQVVELPNDTLPAFWAPEMALVMGAHLNDAPGRRLLANTLAHVWWGSEVSPATRNDAWITNGMARYAELMYVEDEGGRTALERAVTDIAAGAIAYDTTPLSSAGRLDAFAPQFQSMTLEKGAMVFHMLRWEVGDATFVQILRGFLSQYTDRPVRAAELEKVAEQVSQKNLTPFFSQWIDGTGEPKFADKYAVYRLGNGKGFRTIGQIDQDLDLFNMPVELQIETEGKTVRQRIDVVGTETHYVVDTFGRPRLITIDPDNWVLKNTPELQVRAGILRGQQLAAQGDLNGALGEYQKALQVNPQSSLVSYRIGATLFTEKNYQASADAFRDALRGDDDPAWTEVWSHIQLGKIFDVTGQRERAVNEYRQAIQTNDNTQGALNEARLYLHKPYKRPDGE